MNEAPARSGPPETEEGVRELVALQLRAGAFGAAATVLRTYLNQHPENTWARGELCRSLMRLGDFSEVRRLLDQVEKDKASTPEFLALEALWHQLQGAPTRAYKLYEQALQADPTLAWASYNLARLAAESGDDEACERWLDHTLTQDPGHYPARFQRALLYSRTLRPEESARELVETINSNPLMLQPYLLLSELKLRSGEPEQAIEILAHGLQANPLAHALREALARVFATQGDFEAAFGVRLELCRLRGRPEDYLDLGNTALLMGSDEHAVVAFTKAIKEAPSDWRGYYNLAELRRAHGDYEGALPLYEKAHECEPCDRTHHALALWHLEASSALPDKADLHQAMSHLEAALALSPDMPEARYNLVLAYAQRGEAEAAKEAYAQLTKILPADHPLQDNLTTLQEAIAAIPT